MRRIISYFIAGASTVVIFPVLTFAQFGAVAGVVKDSSGAVLPGVTVEAASAVLIEKSRTAGSDEAGQYRVEQLRPGVYTVTFTLPGFRTVRREGIEISAGFTAPINPLLEVGAAGETVNVSAEAPVVDVQTISEQKTLVKTALDALPTARSFATLGTTLPGVQANQRDVGGTQGERGNVLSAHGSQGADMTLQIDGIAIGNFSNGTSWTTFSFNDAAAQELGFETAAVSAETSSGGVRVNVIPREGGNAFHGTVFTNFATHGMQRSNYTTDLKNRGLVAPTGFNKLWDESAGVGGPILRDRLWFFYGQRYRGNDLIGTNSFFSKDPLSPVYNPDLTRPLHAGGWDLDNQLRLTAQLTPHNKVSVFFDRINKCNCPANTATPTVDGESATRLVYPPTWLSSVTWQDTVSSKLVLDAAFAFNRQQFTFVPTADGITPIAPISVVEATTSRRLRAPFPGIGTSGEDLHQKNVRASLSYVTGAHSAKIGFTLHTGHRANTTYAYSNAISYTLFNGNPQSFTLSTAPYTQLQNLNADMGIFAQDKWTLHRLTLTGGLRFDYFNSEIPAQTSAAARFVGVRSFPAVHDVPNWKDINPRVGAAYDLFGNGKTAIRASVSRYVTAQVYAFTQNINPFATTVNTATRTWNDNGNFVPDCDLLNPGSNGECGPMNPNFGKSVVTTRYDPNVSQGWGKRPFNWEYSASVQHQLLRNVSLNAGYFRRTFGNQTVTKNLDITPADYDSFCITAPTNARLGGVSGSQICGLYDIKPEKATLTSNQLITFAKNFSGETSQTYNGVDVNVNARPTGRLFLLAGFSTGRTVTKNCALVNNPQALRFCEIKPPFLGSYRVSGGYTFPWQIEVSGVFQSIPPDPVAGLSPVTGNPAVSLADYPVTSAIATSLGRPIATLGGVITVPLIDPSRYPDFGNRVNQLDLRLTKTVKFERYRIQGIVDFYNAFNTSPVLSYVSTYGPAWLTPASILQSAFVKLGGRLSF